MDGREFTLANLQGSGAQSDEDVQAAASGYAWELHWASITLAANGNFQLTNGADAASTRIVDTTALANEPFIYAPATPLLLTKDAALKITSSGTVKVSAHLVKANVV